MADEKANLPEFRAELNPETRYMHVPAHVLEAHGRMMASDAARIHKLNDHRFRQCCWKLGIEIDEHDTVAESDLEKNHDKFAETADKIVKVEKRLAEAADE